MKMKSKIARTLALTAISATVFAASLISINANAKFMAIGETKDTEYSKKIDFAILERMFAEKGATFEDTLGTLMPEDLEKMNQEELDQLYSLLTAGEIPHGDFDGQILFPEGGPVKRLQKLFEGSMAGTVLGSSLIDKSKSHLEVIGEYFWRGKNFNNKTMVLRNRIKPLLLEHKWFPAKLYCGISKLDARRESIIIDYAYGDTIEGYKFFDKLVTRHRLNIRDEIRMVRPGFYLGRAYLGQNALFVLNFSLYNKEIAAKDNKQVESCLTGEQSKAIARPNVYPGYHRDIASNSKEKDGLTEAQLEEMR